MPCGIKKSKYEFIYEFENDNLKINLLKYLLVIQLSKKRILRSISLTSKLLKLSSWVYE